MHFELQLSARVFEQIVRNRLKALSLCVDREFTDPTGQRLVVDQVVVGAATTIRREQTLELVNGTSTLKPSATQHVWLFWYKSLFNITVPFVQVRQEVLIHLVESSALDANGVNPTAAKLTLQIFPVFNVSLNSTNATQGGGPLTLSYSLAYVDFGLAGLALSLEQRAEITQFIGGVQLAPVTVDIQFLSRLLERPVAAINAGIACDPAGSFVSLRVDIDAITLPSVTKDFFEGGPVDLLAGNDWAMLIDANLITERAEHLAKTTFAGEANIKVESGPTVSWDPAGAAVNISAEIELVDACPFPVDNIDMDATVTIRIAYACRVHNMLHTHLHFDADPSDVGEEILCALTGALLWPFIGAVFLKAEDFDEGLGYYLLGLAGGPLATFIGIIAAIESKGLGQDIANRLPGACTKVDDENYECNDPFFLALPMGTPSPSRLQLERVSGVSEGLVYSGTVTNLTDLPRSDLPPIDVKPFSWQVIGNCTGNRASNHRIGNRATITLHAVPPITLCDAYVLSDPEGEFELNVSDGSVTIDPRFKPSYTNKPYPCRVRLITNRGVRTITMAAPVAQSAPEAEGLKTGLLRAQASCFFWEKHHSPVEKLQWLIDPPFLAEKFIQFWQIVAIGLRNEESIEVAGRDNTALMTAFPSAAGVAHITLLFEQDQAIAELSLTLNGRKEAEETEEPRHQVSVHQILFEHRSTLPVRGSLSVMEFSGTARSPQLHIVDSERDFMLAVSLPSAPALLHSAPRSQEYEPHNLPVHTGKCVSGAPTTGLLMALARLQHRHRRPEAVGMPRIAAVAETLYVRTKDEAVLFDISHPEAPRPLQRYADKAWYEGLALGGKLMAKYNADRNDIEIYQATARRLK